MSKSRGNVVDPNDVVDVYGADVLRLYVLFMGDYERLLRGATAASRAASVL